MVEKANDTNHDRFEQFVSGKTVALVGPSPSTVGRRMGSEIDSADVVVRVNRCVPIAVERMRDIGSRLDVLYNNLNTQIRGMSDDHLGIDPDEWERWALQWLVLVRPINHPRPELKLIGNGGLSAKRDEYLKRENKFDICVVPESIYDPTDKAMGCPNSGTMAMYHLMSMPIASLRVFGFTFYLDGYVSGYSSLEPNDQKLRGIMKDQNIHNPRRQWQAVRNDLLPDPRFWPDDPVREALSADESVWESTPWRNA